MFHIETANGKSKEKISLDKATFEQCIQQPIGTGSFGDVNQFNFPPHMIRSQKEWVIKQGDIKTDEIEILSKYHPTFKIKHENKLASLFGNQYLITEKIKGERLSLENVNKLPFSDFISLINALANELNKYHYYRVKMGAPITHGDINEQNILVDIDPHTHQIKSLEFIDHGLSVKSDGNPNALKAKVHPNLNPNYFPPEVTCIQTINTINLPTVCFFGIKTDIYMFGKMVTNFFRNRLSELNNIYPHLAQLVSDFNKKMTDSYYYARPNTAEVVHFFNLLENYCKAKTNKSVLEDEKLAKLILLSNGWNDQFLSQHNFLFQYDPYFSKAIICLYENKQLNQSIMERLVKSNQYAEIIITLNEHHLLTSCKLNKVLDSEFLRLLLQTKNIHPQSYNFDALTHLSGEIKAKRKDALFAIQYLLAKAQSEQDVDAIKTNLIDLAKKSQINYLFKSHALFNFVNHHQWKGMNVSNIWLNIMDQIETRKHFLASTQRRITNSPAE